MEGQNFTFEQLKDMQIAMLAEEKAKLLHELGDLFIDDDELWRTGYGVSGYIAGLPGMLAINCGKSDWRKPCDKTGVGRGRLSLYHWIPFIYREEDANFERCYTLSLCREDIDISTGNLHTDFYALQLTRLGSDGPEVGGQVNPCPEKDPDYPDAYNIQYRAGDSFPIAVRGDQKLPRKVTSDNAPWGYTGLEGDIPIMELDDSAYDAQKVAQFALKLIEMDINGAKKNQGNAEE